MKRCSKCKQNKSLSEFNFDKHAKDGKHYACRSCQRAYQNALTRKKTANRPRHEKYWVDPKANFVKRKCLCCTKKFETANDYRMCPMCRCGQKTRGYDDFYAEAA